MTQRTSMKKFLVAIIFLASCSTEKKAPNEPLSQKIDSIAVTAKQEVESLATPKAFEIIDTAHFEFSQFIRLFDEDGITPIPDRYDGATPVRNEIPVFAAVQFMDAKDQETSGDRYYSGNHIELADRHLLFYMVYKLAGPGMDEWHSISFDKQGKRFNDIVIGHGYPSTSPDGEGEDFSYFFDSDRRFLQVTNQFMKWDEEKQKEITTETFQYFKLDDEQGWTEAEGRIYSFASEQLLSSEDLQRYDAEELKLIRNEIYASHGYIFKTEPLKTYFAKKAWYLALAANVDEMLTDIERQNIKVILKAEGSK
jgi:hypothetical protein